MADKILIVDDNPHVLKLLKISLEKAGYQVILAEDGDEGLEKANQYLPDLIVSDVMMPQTDGIEFCWMIRENSNIPMIPFIFLTSLEEPEMEIRGFRAGADEYLVKPVDRRVLLDKVSTLLNRVKRVKAMDADDSTQLNGFEGNLVDLSLVEVIQLLNMNKRSGTLQVMGKESGKIIFKDGNMIFAETDEVSGIDAINRLVRLKEGMFKFEPAIEYDVPNIAGSTMNILLEALRLMDEANFKKDLD